MIKLNSVPAILISILFAAQQQVEIDTALEAFFTGFGGVQSIGTNTWFG